MVAPPMPPGFRFHPTDEELVLHYLMNQAAGLPCPVPIIAEVDIYKFDPWELPGRAVFGEKEWYFFSPRDRKYPNGARPNRAAGTGYWKATGTDKPIGGTGGNASSSIGVKKALVFYRGKPPKGAKTDWIMHEYRLTEAKNKPIKIRAPSMRLDDWVLCRIYKKSQQQMRSPEMETEDSSAVFAADGELTPEMESPAAFSTTADEPFGGMTKSNSLADLIGSLDYSCITDLLADGGGAGAGGSFYEAMNRLDSVSAGGGGGFMLQPNSGTDGAGLKRRRTQEDEYRHIPCAAVTASGFCGGQFDMPAPAAGGHRLFVDAGGLRLRMQ